MKASAEVNINKVIKEQVGESAFTKILAENEVLCNTCGGTGILAFSNSDESFFTLCNCCRNGKQKMCEHCGKISKPSAQCDCNTSVMLRDLAKGKEYQHKILKAKQVTTHNTYLYNHESNEYYADEDEFWERVECDDEPMPYDDILWVMEEENISIDAYNLLQDACSDLHEDAFDAFGNKDIEEFQGIIDNFLDKYKSQTVTYYPAYKEYIKIERKDNEVS